MPRYMEIIKSFETSVIDENGRVDRSKINDKLENLIRVSHEHIPEDYHAIIINNLSNKAHAAFIDMETVTKAHYRAIDSYIKISMQVEEKIDIYLS